MVPAYDQTCEEIQIEKKAGARIQFRIRNLVDEFHKKTTKWVCENYSTIFLPKFETQMVSKRQRKINSKTARKNAHLESLQIQDAIDEQGERVPKLPSYYLW
jgi:putative transposase